MSARDAGLHQAALPLVRVNAITIFLTVCLQVRRTGMEMVIALTRTNGSAAWCRPASRALIGKITEPTKTDLPLMLIPLCPVCTL